MKEQKVLIVIACVSLIGLGIVLYTAPNSRPNHSVPSAHSLFDGFVNKLDEIQLQHTDNSKIPAIPPPLTRVNNVNT